MFYEAGYTHLRHYSQIPSNEKKLFLYGDFKKHKLHWPLLRMKSEEGGEKGGNVPHKS